MYVVAKLPGLPDGSDGHFYLPSDKYFTNG